MDNHFATIDFRKNAYKIFKKEVYDANLLYRYIPNVYIWILKSLCIDVSASTLDVTVLQFSGRYLSQCNLQVDVTVDVTVSH